MKKTMKNFEKMVKMMDKKVNEKRGAVVLPLTSELRKVIDKEEGAMMMIRECASDNNLFIVVSNQGIHLIPTEDYDETLDSLMSFHKENRGLLIKTTHKGGLAEINSLIPNEVGPSVYKYIYSIRQQGGDDACQILNV